MFVILHSTQVFGDLTMIIWEAKLDDIYDCKVVRLTENTGKLTMTDQFDRILLDKEVELMYGAVFGPEW